MEPEQHPPAEDSGADLAGFTEVKSKKSKRARRSFDSQGANSDEECSPSTSSNINKKNRRDEVMDESSGRQQGHVIEGQHQQRHQEPREEMEGEREMETPQSDDHRLVFPNDCRLTVQEKVLWTVQLAREHRSFSPVYREGRNRPFVSVTGQEAVDLLTKEGYKGVKLQIPEASQEATKIIIFRYPVYLDPDLVMDEPRIQWAYRHRVRGEERGQVIALIKGAPPTKIFVTGIGYRPVARYVEEPPFCLRCSRWGHAAWKCQTDPRCRFCGRSHNSTVCSNKIKEQTKIVPRCANCRGEHNARSIACPFNPKHRPEIAPPDPRHPPAPAPPPRQPAFFDPPPTRNVWEQGRPAILGVLPPRLEESQVSGHLAAPAPRNDLAGHASHSPSAPNLPPTAVGEASPAPPCTQPIPTTNGNELLYDLVTKLCDKIDHLEKEVMELKKSNVKSEGEQGEKKEKSGAEANQGNKGATECKVKINGNTKVVKTHKVITGGVEGINQLLQRCEGDEAKKAKVFEGWKEVHKSLDKFMKDMEGVTGIAMEVIEVDA